MNGTELLNNMVDELDRTRDLLLEYINGEEASVEISQELFEDIRVDLDRYYEVAEEIDILLEKVEI